MTKIKNFGQLAVNEARKEVLSIAEAGLEAIDTKKVIENLIRAENNTLAINSEKFPLNNSGKVIFIGVGKCAVEGGIIFEKILGENLTGGIVSDVKSSSELKKIKSLRGSHPLPSEQNIKLSKEIIQSLEGLNSNDLVVFLISGGGSTLLCLPKSEKPDQEILIFKELTRQGATIQEINTVRKHLSLARGGWLAKRAYPAKVISLIFSDVPDNDIAFVSSGPTYQDNTTVDDAKKVLLNYKIRENFDLIETPKEEKYFKNVRNILAVSNKTALEAMTKKARELALTSQIQTSQLTGESSKVAKIITKELHKARINEVLLYGGEVTVKVKGKGRGGRNLQLGLSALKYIKDNEIILTMASDGRDNGPFGGAICDQVTRKTIEGSGISIKKALKNNDSYPLFEKIGNYLIMDDTGSNVSDLIIAMKI